MQINVSGKHVDLSDALRTRVSNSLGTIAGKYFDHAMEAHVTFGRARSFFTCDINMHAGRGLQLRGEGEAADANAAFDDAAEHIAVRLRRYRERVNQHHRDEVHRERGESAKSYVLSPEPDVAEIKAANNGASHPPEPEEPVVNGAHAPCVVAETQTEILRLSVGDAVMRMDLANQAAVMFRNAGNGRLNVVYRRNDGHIGWIDPAQ